jgi:hypothetical protein
MKIRSLVPRPPLALSMSLSHYLPISLSIPPRLVSHTLLRRITLPGPVSLDSCFSTRLHNVNSSVPVQPSRQRLEDPRRDPPPCWDSNPQPSTGGPQRDSTGVCLAHYASLPTGWSELSRPGQELGTPDPRGCWDFPVRGGNVGILLAGLSVLRVNRQ